jgi:hypothetical protein
MRAAVSRSGTNRPRRRRVDTLGRYMVHDVAHDLADVKG